MTSKHDFKNKLRCMRNGGYVPGPGGPTDDKVPAMLSHGEYVLPADTVQAVGAHRLDALRNETHTPAVGGNPNRRPSKLRMLRNGGLVEADFIPDEEPGIPRANEVDQLEKLKAQNRMAQRLEAARPTQTLAGQAAAAEPSLAARATGAAESALGKARALPGTVLRGAAALGKAAGIAAPAVATAYQTLNGGQRDNLGGLQGSLLRQMPSTGNATADSVMTGLASLPFDQANAAINTGRNLIAPLTGGLVDSGAAPAAPSAAPTPAAPITKTQALAGVPALMGGTDLLRDPQGRVRLDNGQVISKSTSKGGVNAYASAGGPQVSDDDRAAASRSDYLRNIGSLDPSDYGGFLDAPGPRGNAGAINSQFDKAAQEIRDLHDSARFHARGEESSKLLRLAEARAGALGQDYATTQGGYNNILDNQTARAGQKGAQAISENKARQSAQTELAKLGLERSDKTFDRFSKISEGLFSAPDADGKPQLDAATHARFLSSVAENAPQLLAMDPLQAAPYLSQAYAAFQDTEQANKDNPDAVSSKWTFAKGLPQVNNVTLGEVYDRPAISLGDYARSKLAPLPGVDDYQAYDDSEGRRVKIRKGDRDQLRRQYGKE